VTTSYFLTKWYPWDFSYHDHQRIGRLSNCDIGDHGINLLHNYLCGNKENKQEIKAVFFSNNQLTGASSSLIGDIITHLQPHSLRLDGNNITGLKDISPAVVSTNSVKVLEFWSNDITVHEAPALSDMMMSLEELDISSSHLDDNTAQILSEAIKITNTLKALYLNNNDIKSTGAIATANSLSHNNSLKELWMSKNPIGEDGVVAIAQGIASNTTLKKLYLCDNGIRAAGAIAVAKVLTTNASLEELHLNENDIGQDGATAIAQAIMVNKTLKKLSLLRSDKRDDDLAIIILRSLHYNNTIIKLYLPQNLGNLKEKVDSINDIRKKYDLEVLKVKFK